MLPTCYNTHVITNNKIRDARDCNYCLVIFKCIQIMLHCKVFKNNNNTSINQTHWKNYIFRIVLTDYRIQTIELSVISNPNAMQYCFLFTSFVFFTFLKAFCIKNLNYRSERKERFNCSWPMGLPTRPPSYDHPSTYPSYGNLRL